MNEVRRLETELKLRGFSKNTVKTYTTINQKFLDFIKKQPEDITQDDIKLYLSEVISEKEPKARTISLMISGLKFFYKDVLEKEIFTKIKAPKIQRNLPTVLTKDEIKLMLKQKMILKHRLLIEFMYSSGLRVSEVVSLKIMDLEFDEKMGTVREGKGKKDRNIILSESLIKHLKRYLDTREEVSEYVFPGREGHLTERMAQKVVKTISLRAGIKKNVYCHALRSTFATHLLEEGVDIRIIQELLGHADLSTTQIYVKVSKEQLKKVKSPLDGL